MSTLRPLGPPVDPEQLLQLHRRLCAGGLEAWREIGERLFAWLCAKLPRALPRGFPRPNDLCCYCDAVTRALEGYRSAPDRFDPVRGWSLSTYLLRVALRHLLNGLRSRGRTEAHTASVPPKKLEKLCRTCRLPEYRDMESKAAPVKALINRCARLLCALPDLERLVVQFHAVGFRETERYVRLLHLEELPLAEQRREVKKVKDRVLSQIRRHANRKVVFRPSKPCVHAEAPGSWWDDFDIVRWLKDWCDLCDPVTHLLVRAGREVMKAVGPEAIFEIALDLNGRKPVFDEFMGKLVNIYSYRANRADLVAAALSTFQWETPVNVILISTRKKWLETLAWEAAQREEDELWRRRALLGEPDSP